MRRIALAKLQRASLDYSKNQRTLPEKREDCRNEVGSQLIPTAHLDCDCILCHVLGTSRSWILSHPDSVLEDTKVRLFMDKIDLRCIGFPVAYIVGKKEFYGRDFFVSPAVLIPKPDTETLVERGMEIILEELQAKNDLRLVDLCTGSGCVGISVWKELESRHTMERMRFFATDISSDALEVAKKNCHHHGCSIEFILCDLLESDSLRDLDGIISNPPYVPAEVSKRLLEDGRSEPLLALDGDCDGSRDGTGLISRLLPQAFSVVKKGGFLLLETGEYNAETTASMMKKIGFADVQIHSDLSGMPRVVEGWKTGEL